MPQTCPDCGSLDTMAFVDEIGQQVCSQCGAVSQELQFYHPTTRYDVAYALGGPTADRVASSSLFDSIGVSGPPFWTRTLEDSRRRSEFVRKPEVDARIQGTLATLGYPGLFAQVDFLFQRARQESWKGASKGVQAAEADIGEDSAPVPVPDGIDQVSTSSLPTVPSSMLPSSFTVRRVRWGTDSLLLATACCYVVLRREGVRIDLETVSDAAHLPYPNVRRAFKLLRLLVKDAVRNVQLSNPDSYVGQVIAFFRSQLKASLAARKSRILSANVVKFLKLLQPSNTSQAHRPGTCFEDIEATVLDICAFWWPRREVYATNPRLAAYAAVVLAIEVRSKTLAPLLEIFRFTYQALSFDPSTCSDSADSSPSDDPTSKRAVALYGQICSSLRLQAATIPWLEGLKPISRKSRAKAEAQGGSTTDLVRRDLVVHALDVLQVWRAVSSKRTDEGSPGASVAPISRVEESSSQQDRRTSVQEDLVEEQAEVDVGNDELDCFISNALDGAQPTEIDVEADADVGSAEDDSGDDVQLWPRIEERVRSAISYSDHRSEAAEKHPIDQLSDQQVDELLFQADEFKAILRTDAAELAAFERAKVATGDWPASVDDTGRNKARRPESGRSEADKKRSRSAESTKRQRRKKEVQPDNRLTANVWPPVELREQQEESDWSD